MSNRTNFLAVIIPTLLMLALMGAPRGLLGGACAASVSPVCCCMTKGGCAGDASVCPHMGVHRSSLTAPCGCEHGGTEGPPLFPAPGIEDLPVAEVEPSVRVPRLSVVFESASRPQGSLCADAGPPTYVRHCVWLI